MEDDGENGDTTEKVKELTTDLDQLGKDNNLSGFTGKTKTKRLPGNYGRNQPGTSVHGSGGGGGAAEQLETCGYEVVPDVFETDGGTWELISKVQHRNHFSIHDVALTILSCSYHLTSARCIDGAIRIKPS